MEFGVAKQAFRAAMGQAHDGDAIEQAEAIATAIRDYRSLRGRSLRSGGRPTSHAPLFRACCELFELRRRIRVRAYLPDGGRSAIAEALVQLLWSAVDGDVDSQKVVANHFPSQVRALRQAELAA